METPKQPIYIGSYRELLARSIHLYRASFSQVFLLALLFSFIAFLPKLIFFFLSGNLPASPSTMFGLSSLFSLIANIIALTFFIALLWRIYCVKINRHEPFAEDFSLAIRRVGYAVVASLIESVMIWAVFALIYCMQKVFFEYPEFFINNGKIFFYLMVLFQFFLIIYVSTLFLFLVPIIAIENKGIIPAIQKSIYLIWNHWWRVLSLQLIPWIVYWLVLVFIKTGLSIPIQILPLNPNPQAILPTLLQVLIFAIFIPWVASLLLIQLEDLEIRKARTTT